MNAGMDFEMSRRKWEHVLSNNRFQNESLPQREKTWDNFAGYVRSQSFTRILSSTEKSFYKLAYGVDSISINISQ